MRHHTKDPAVRAAHISNHAERIHEDELLKSTGDPYADWPRFWLNTYRESLAEIGIDGKQNRQTERESIRDTDASLEFESTFGFDRTEAKRLRRLRQVALRNRRNGNAS